ncbi:hypothetical protein [Lentzea sp. NEAU-D7]|uniref:hypothetical protein n=1 Tax=Lentzea sp. NEAU-D7 TaxID=2994667 RepID=UPI00224AEC8F|nr:hypothetical protein [Lentzea sp. NEAU-D7]MCX2951502.1 hypothetical protein [Lentzea sp. NEAU-D7]
MKPASAGELMTAVARGDRTAFGQVYDLLAVAVFGLVVDMIRAENGQVDPDVAETAALDAWTHVWRKAPALTDRPLSSAEAISWVLSQVRERCSLVAADRGPAHEPRTVAAQFPRGSSANGKRGSMAPAGRVS